jgi:hypothetical protein
MADIIWGLAVVGMVAFGAFGLTLFLTRKLPRYANDLLAFLVVLLIFAYIRYLWYHPRLATILPFSNLVIVGNWFPVVAGALGGLAWRRIPGKYWRKSFFIGGLSFASIYSVVWPLLGETPSCMNIWKNQICVQTTAKTCTPACAATLLRKHGIYTTEREMADLCLTRSGTTWQGLYRGLKIKTAGTPWDVEVLDCDASRIMEMYKQPMIVSVGLPSKSSDRIAMNEWGWKPGIGHSVVYMGDVYAGRIMVADPTPNVGMEDWSVDEFQYLYRGTAMRLVKRP